MAVTTLFGASVVISNLPDMPAAGMDNVPLVTMQVCLRMAASPPMAAMLRVKISLAVGRGPFGCGTSGVMAEFGVGALAGAALGVEGAVISSPLPKLFGSLEGIADGVVAGVTTGFWGATASGGVAVGAWVPLGLEPNASLCACDGGAKKATDRIKIANDFMVDPLKSDKCTFAISNDLWT